MWKKWNGTQILNNIKNASNVAVVKTSDIVLMAAKQEVPLRERTLMDSGIVILKYTNKDITAVISFGGGSGTGRPIVPYAKRWHETQANFQHGRKWKYLKSPFDRLAQKTFDSIIKLEIRKSL